MLKRSIKYLAIAAVNMCVLTVLLTVWADELELKLHYRVLPVEFLKIIGFTVLSLIAMRLLVAFFRKADINSIKQRMKLSVLAAFLICSYLYVGYSLKIINNVFINGSLRNEISSKIKPSKWLEGSRAQNLTIKEYQEIVKISWFPKVPEKATNIEYDYQAEGFLPDYEFTLIYDLPIGMNVGTMSYDGIRFSKYRTFKIIGDKKRVTYFEGLQ